MKDRLKKIREKYGLNQSAFAARIGVSRAAVCKFEKGESNLSSSTIINICREFNINESWLRDGSGDMLIDKSAESEVARIVGNAFADGDEFIIKTFLALGQLTPQQWQLVKDFVEKIKSGT